MADHLTDSEMRQFKVGELSAEKFLEAGDHLEACGDCRNRLAAFVASPQLINAPLEFEHATYEQLAALASNGPVDLRLATHIRQCPQCRAEVEDLRQFAKTIPKPRSRALRYYLPAAIAAAIAVIAIALTRPGMKTPSLPTAPAETLAFAIHDAGQTIGIDHDGKPAGLSALALTDQSAVVDALRAGRISVTPAPDTLKSNRSVLLGPGGDTEQFRVLTPIGEIVLAARPEFRWQALKGALRYRVEIYDLSFTLIAASPDLRELSWTPSNPLPRGKTFVWQVSAIRGDEKIRAPQPPAPEARFQIVSEAQAAAVERARSAEPVSHLLVAIRLAQAGLQNEASKELDQLAAENPDSTLVKSLRDSLLH